MKFCAELKRLREEKGVTQAKLAQEIHVSRSAVAKWENGLGMPGEDSLRLLADYFGRDPEAFLPDEEIREAPAMKKCPANRKRKILMAILGGSAAIFLFLGMFVEALRQTLPLCVLGVMLIALGIFNMKGNIASIHWYNRRRVSQQDQLPYCRLMGLGTLLIGAGITVSGVVQIFWGTEVASALTVAGIIVGCGLMLYAQFKYNKGIF